MRTFKLPDLWPGLYAEKDLDPDPDTTLAEQQLVLLKQILAELREVNQNLDMIRMKS